MIDIVFENVKYNGKCQPVCVLHMAVKKKGKGYYFPKAKSKTKGWDVRRDSPGAAYEDQPRHYHAIKGDKEIVITEDGFGSHDTITDTEIPTKLGDYLVSKGVKVKNAAVEDMQETSKTKNKKRKRYVIRHLIDIKGSPSIDLDELLFLLLSVKSNL
ncbi:hypothetical protein [Photobacterium carnosum]|uniref:hypothetical protein n=1 Tax=Photobacterium carnosum TaxID=2023717 RepID=UPI001E4B3581|nr:hypothetical protein [Photobacterium carnosum]MCD9527569.1 hypothetical protein [Photobacterium carnosum]